MAIRFRKCFSTTNEEQPSTFWKKERDDFEIVPRKPPPSPLIVGLRVFHLRRNRSVKSLFGRRVLRVRDTIYGAYCATRGRAKKRGYGVVRFGRLT